MSNEFLKNTIKRASVIFSCLFFFGLICSMILPANVQAAANPVPEITVSMLPDLSVTADDVINVSGFVKTAGDVGLQGLMVNGMPVSVDTFGIFSSLIKLSDGNNVIEIIATDITGSVATISRTISLDKTVQPVYVTSPADNSVVTHSALDVIGSVPADVVVTVSINSGSSLQIKSSEGSFTAPVTLLPGINTIVVTITTADNKTSSLKRTVVFDAAATSLAITDSVQDNITFTNSLILKGEVPDYENITGISITSEGETFSPRMLKGSFEQTLSFSEEKIYRILVSATNFAGQKTTVQRNIYHVMPISKLTSPQNGVRDVDGTKPFTWTTVAGAQGYYLYLGSSVGAKDIHDSGEMQFTSKLIPNLPVGQTIYARMWTKFNGLWYYSDSSFSLAATLVDIQLTYPQNGASNVDGTKPFRWTTVPGAQAYYLYLGSTAGAKDIHDSGETQLVSKLIPNLPVGQTIYARMWIKFNGLWYYSDSSFSLAATVVDIQLTYPQNGVSNVDGTKPFTWTTVAGAQGYYLYLGSSVGAKDIHDSGVTQLTSRIVPNMPVGQTIYARMWTKFNGLWYYSDSSFSLAATLVDIQLTYPQNGASNVDGTKPFRWTTVPGAQAYYLYLGSTAGAKDIHDSGETQLVSKLISNLPVNQTIYARMWVKYSGGWYYSDSSFNLSATKVDIRLTYPQSGVRDVDGTKPFTWTTVAGAQGYYLYLGSSVGAKDIHDSGVTQLTSKIVPNLPIGQTIYARMWTKFNGLWYYSDSSFSLAATVVDIQLTYPQNGASNVDGTKPFRWTTVPGAQAYYLYIGSLPGSKDIFDSGELQTSSLSVSGSFLWYKAMYVRIWVKVNGAWYYKDSSFTSNVAPVLDTVTAPTAKFIYPLNDSSDVDGATLFEWEQLPDAESYYLLVGTQPGTGDVHDSGELNVQGLSSVKRFVNSLPLNITLYARLYTKINSKWRYSDVSFSASQNSNDFSKRLDAAIWATAQVRSMANEFNVPYSATELSKIDPGGANCFAYARTLNNILHAINVGASRVLNIAFIANTWDGHSLVEFYNEEQAVWMLLDPTFNMTMKTVSGNRWASAEDISNSTRSKQWGDIEYINLGVPLVNNYYLDYPLLYLNVYHENNPLIIGGGLSPLPYLEEVVLPVENSYYDNYILRADSAGSRSVLIDGNPVQVIFDGQDGLSKTYTAKNISIPVGSALRAYRAKRYVFK